MGFVDTLFDPFIDNAFMQRALLAGILVALMCAVVGTYVVLRGMAFIGDALAHGVLPGVAGAVIFGFSSLLGAAIGAGVMIGGVSLVTKRSKLSSDTAIGLLFVGLLAIGVVMVSSSDRLTGDIDAILFGEFLGVDWWDIRVLGVAVVLVGAVVMWSYRPFAVLCFDVDLARAMGYRADIHHRTMLVMVAATIVVSFQSVGALLVFGMLLGPAGAGALIARRIGVMMAWAAGIGALSVYFGLLVSYHWDWAAGASVVVVAVAFFFAVLIVVEIRRALAERREPA
ncbi:MAG: metal ABC transporter permease [Ilumatobacteraceae bacterium]